MDRIKFYGINDLSFYYCVNQVENFLKNIDINKRDYDINDILEFCNILKVVEIKNLNLKKLFKNQIEYLYRQKNIFIDRLNEISFPTHFKKINNQYFDDFWELLDDNHQKLNFSSDFIKRIFKYKNFSVRYFLQCKNLTYQYNFEIKDYLIKYWGTAEILLDEYEIENDRHKKLYLPSFTNEECNQIFLNYINNENVNLNYLQIIPDLKSKEINISDDVRLKAFKKAKEKSDAMFDKGSGIQFTNEVKFGNFNESINIIKRDNTICYEYSTNWIKENLDYPTLLNNFIYLFNFVDLQMRFLNVNKKNQMGIFEAFLGVHTKNEYKTGFVFKMLQSTASMQIIAYNQILEKFALNIEKCLDWFYAEYLNKEFGVQDFITHIESTPKDYFEKCRILFPEIDGILKQFSIYIEYKKIDHDLIEISSNSVPFENIKSLNKNKYVYANSSNLNNIFYYMFSNQSGLYYLKGYERHGSLYDLLKNEKVKLKNFGEYKKQGLLWLINNKILKNDRQGNLTFYNNKEMLIYYDLFKNEVISFYHYPQEYQKTIISLVKKGKLCFKDTLFSEPEVKYLNYYLNDRGVSNGLSIRNRYGHGTQPRKDNENLHRQNYNYLLYLMVLITIKINDDFCIYSDNERKRFENTTN